MEHQGKRLSASLTLGGTLTPTGGPCHLPGHSPDRAARHPDGNQLPAVRPALLSVNLTRLQYELPASPYHGEGFSILYYNTANGAGSGWAYNRETYPGIADLEGVVGSPMRGFLCGAL